MKKLLFVIEGFIDITGRALSLLIIPMIAVVLYTAAQRYFFKEAVPWGFELALFTFGLQCIVGGGYTLQKGGHVMVDVIINRLPFKLKTLVGIFNSLVILAVAALIIYLGTRWAYRSTLILERSIHGTEWNPQIWWYKWMVPFSALLIALQSLADILKNFMLLRSPSGKGASSPEIGLEPKGGKF